MHDLCSLLSPGETVLICAEILFCYCFNFIITIIVYEWEWASCQPQCPLSQFHCPRCDHMGALWHLSTLFRMNRTRDPLWWTAQSRRSSSRTPTPPPPICVFAVNMHTLNLLMGFVLIGHMFCFVAEKCSRISQLPLLAKKSYGLAAVLLKDGRTKRQAYFKLCWIFKHSTDERGKVTVWRVKRTWCV